MTMRFALFTKVFSLFLLCACLVMTNARLASAHALRAAEKIRLALNAPFTLEQLPQQVLPSIGGALYPLHAQEATQLLQQADTAMYAAKRAGGNRIQLASPHGAMPGQDGLPG